MTPLRRTIASIALASATLALPLSARAEVTLNEGKDWQVFSEGRINGFVSYANGDGYPVASKDPNGNQVALRGGGLEPGDAAVEPKGPTMDAAGNPLPPTQGKHESMRVRSGFLGNILGIGARKKLTNDGTTIKGFISIWAHIESEERRKYRPVLADVREGYLKAEGPWGSFLVGRSLTLFSRGATEIDFLYGHGYGLGYPGSVDVNGPAAGHIGFGVLANGFAAGLVYATPVLGGLQLTVGAYDPSMLVGSWERTKWLRPEAELTYEAKLGESGKLKLFGNGGWQKVYLKDSKESTTAAGVGYGGRVEVGPVHLGLAGHYGQGLGLNYALQSSDANVGSIAQKYELRKTDGYYAQGQLALGKLDVNLGVGVTRVHLNASDKVDDRDDDVTPTTSTANDDANAAAQDPVGYSVIKQQLGISAGVVYHFTKSLHFDVDYFRAQFAWYLGERQNMNFVNAGATIQW